jgi:hypothetical protein
MRCVELAVLDLQGVAVDRGMEDEVAAGVQVAMDANRAIRTVLAVWDEPGIDVVPRRDDGHA